MINTLVTKGFCMNIYMITNLINNKIYIGQDSYDEPNYFGSGKLIKKAIKKYGKKNFKKEILEHCSTRKELDEREIAWIKKKKSQKRGVGYNITKGGYCPPSRKGVKLSKEIKAKISKNKKGVIWGSHSEETKKKMSELRMGIKFSPEHKKKLSIARKKRIITKDTRARMKKASIGKINIKKYILHSPSGKEYITESGLADFCRKYDLTPSNLHKVLNGERKHHKKWRIKRYDNK